MKAHRFIATALAAASLGLGAASLAAQVEITNERLVAPDRLREIVDVRDVRMNDDGTVSGVVVNRSDHPVKDVQLIVKYMWLWNHETRPGNDPPGRAVFVTVPRDLPPGAQATFTYRPDAALPSRPDGRFEPAVQVSAVTEITQGTAETERPVPRTEVEAAPSAAR